jgi:nucleotide-binding universal stress UspA family protein
MKVLVLCDGSSDPRPSLTHGIARARDTQGELVALHVIQRRPERGRFAEPGLTEKALQETLRRLEQTRAWVHEQGSDIRTNAAFSIIKDHEDILRYARDTGVELIVAPTAYESLFDKACCLVDIVAAEEGAVAVS